MKTKELWRWRLRNKITGRPYTSRYVMTEADAMELDPLAERVAFSKEAGAPGAGERHRNGPTAHVVDAASEVARSAARLWRKPKESTCSYGGQDG